MILVDSDILIWVMRGDGHAGAFLDAIASPAISAVSYIELVQGMRNRRELAALAGFMRIRSVRLLPITEPISARAVKRVERYFLSHDLQLADALIAASALEHKIILATGNTKHFKTISGLKLKPYAR
jgi:predicted nucleic acid-binding protein